MNDPYLTVKWIHILSSTILFGTGIGTAFIFFVANRRRNIEEQAYATWLTVRADWLFTLPSGFVQFGTGLYLLHITGHALTDMWVQLALGLFFLALAAWAPVVWLQIQMARMAVQAKETSTPLPAKYWRYDRLWISLGCVGFPALLAVFWLMVARPA